MNRIIVVIAMVLIVLAVAISARTTAFAVNVDRNYMHDYDDYNNYNSYKNYWTENKENIAETFNPYIDGFHEGLVDYVGLRNKINKESAEINKLSETLANNKDNNAENKENNADSEIDIAYNLHKFVYEMEYENVDENLDAEQILKLGKGDCTEKSLLLYSLLDANNINAYIANGDGHMYVFANIDGIWLPIETTSHDLFFVYKNINNGEIMKKYKSLQPFLVNRTTTLFNEN